ncbi:MAG: DUF4349 domain-containing protein [Actinomycetota bacterium]
MRRLGLIVFAFLALSAVVGFVATGGLSAGGANGAASAPAAMASGSAVAGRAVAGSALAPAAGNDSAVGGAGAGGGVAEGSSGFASVGGLPPVGPAVVKTASLEVQVAKGDFDQSFQTAMQVAGRYGGYVESSSTSGTRIHSGSITIRVPSTAFDRAMADLTGLGTVESRSVSGQDVTNEYVDLNARLRTWEAQEAVLLRLMKRATSVEATLRVQSNLQDVQFRIEQIKGQLRVLENQTELATIDVSMHEPGVVIHPLQIHQADERPSLAEAWTKAVDGFLGVLYATVVGLGYLVPIALICLVVWFAVRRVRPATSS